MPEEIKADRGILNRDVSIQASKTSGAPDKLPAGTIVYRWVGQKFGAEKLDEILVTGEPDKPPFFSVPRNAVDWDDPEVNLL